ncbi:MAG TPA: alpha/beta hydrolase [Verrucomicrobiaceae bacterium]
MRFTFILALVSAAAICPAKPPEPPENFEVTRDVPYADTSNPKQTLDLFLPTAKTGKPRPMIVFIHGGGWESGDKADVFVGLLFPLIKDGAFAGASVNYRLTDEARWPAQIYDCKAAIRWLRTHAKEMNVDPGKIGVIGISAGGHLVSLLGTSGGVPELEGDLGRKTSAGSKVQCVVNICGPSDFLTITDHPSIIKFNEAGSCTGKLFGKPMPDAKDLARAASPVTYVTPDDPPVLTVHGTKDTLVPFEQATEFREALTKAGVPNALITAKDGGHVFVHPEILERERVFFEKWLLGRDQPKAMEDATVEIAAGK